MSTPSDFDGGYQDSGYQDHTVSRDSGHDPHGQQQGAYVHPESRAGGTPPYFGPVQPMAPTPAPKNRGVLWAVIGALGVVLVAVIAVFVTMFVIGGHSNTVTAAATSTEAPPPLTTPPTASPSTRQPDPAPSVVVVPGPPAQVPSSSATRCTPTYGAVGPYSQSASGNGGTTCAFAEQVRLAYGQSGGGSGYINAYSPVTGVMYRMYCSGYNPVTCTGGNNAVVYIY